MKKLFEKGNSFLGTKYPILGGAMTLVSESNLVSAISNAGGLGVLACGSMDTIKLESEILLTKKKTQKQFGVNLILKQFHTIGTTEISLTKIIYILRNCIKYL